MIANNNCKGCTVALLILKVEEYSHNKRARYCSGFANSRVVNAEGVNKQALASNDCAKPVIKVNVEGR